MKFLILAIVIIMFSVFLLGEGEKIRQREVEKRALLMEKKDCYEWQDIEIIIFGEIQQ